MDDALIVCPIAAFDILTKLWESGFGAEEVSSTPSVMARFWCYNNSGHRL
jgi:hypothetical protein